ncbi:unnamed protein product [Amoebophrya sp. A25]|nr:unnamed protein product [Amoebophrya sp. A25]|eukprot:GSA25T00001369001.1
MTSSTEAGIPASRKRSASDSDNLDIVFVTGNQNKVNEVNKYFAELKKGKNVETANTGNGTSATASTTSKIIRPVKVDLPELQGEPEEISVEKCRAAYNILRKDESKVAKDKRLIVLTEDTSLCYNALQGLPGPYIKWFLDKLGCDGLVRLLAGWEDKSAYAQTIFACVGDVDLTDAIVPEKKSSASSASGAEPQCFTFVGRTHGRIVEPRGSGNFTKGWDPVFLPEESTEGLTYAEMSPEAKNLVSHRSRSLAKLHAFLADKLGIEF